MFCHIHIIHKVAQELRAVIAPGPAEQIFDDGQLTSFLYDI